VSPVNSGVSTQPPDQFLSRVPVEGGALAAGLQQPLLIGLAVHGDQIVGEIDQRADRNGAATGVRTGTPLGRHHSGDDQRVVIEIAAELGQPLGDLALRVDHDPAFDERSVGARPDPLRVGPPTEQQSQTGDHHGLPGACLAGDHVESRGQVEDRLLDDPEALDSDLLDHRPIHPVARLPSRPCRLSYATP
jgi:hypothetical protein